MSPIDDLFGAEVMELPPEFQVPPASPSAPDPDTVQGQLKEMAVEARNWFQENIEPDMAEATDYYYGRPFGKGREKDGQSKIVSTDLRDVTMSQIPDLLRIFFGPEQVVRFNPRGEEDVPMAEQMTEGVQYAVEHHDGAFLEFHAWMKDALVRRIGWMTWWWENDEYEQETLVLDPAQAQALLQGAQMNGQPVQILDVQEAPDTFGLYQVTVEYQTQTGNPAFAAVPPEEVWFTPSAKSLDDVNILVWSRERTVGEVEELGYDREELEPFIGERDHYNTGDMKYARRVGSGPGREAGVDHLRSTEGPVSTRPIVFSEVFMKVDAEDGGSEIRRFECVGNDFHILNGEGELVEEIPFAYLTPEPEPHTIIGLSNWDLHKDIQLVKSQLQREMLNSLARSVDERMEVVANEVSIADLLNPMASKYIRVRRPGMLREITHTFVGQQVLPVLAYYDQVKEDRGVPRAAAGLDPDALQSSTRAGVVATIQGAKAKVEMIARIFAETGYKRLFKGMARLMRQRGAPTLMRVSGKQLMVDPTSWNLDLDLTVEVALGVTDKDTQLQAIQAIIQGQAQLKEAGAPFVGNQHVRHAFAKAVELAGYKDVSNFVAPWGQEQEQQYQQMLQEQQQNQQSPEEMLFMVEQAKMALEQEKLALDREKMLLEDERKRDEMELKAAVEQLKLQVDEMKAKMDLKAKVSAAKEATRGS